MSQLNLISYEAFIVQALGKLVAIAENPDSKNNTGRYLGELFLWRTVFKIAEGRVKDLWDRMESNGLIESKELTAGEHELARSPNFVATAKVSNPVKRFDPNELAKALNKKYKVPMPVVIEMVEKAKVPTKGTVSKSVIEKST